MSEQKLRPSKAELSKLVDRVSDIIRTKTGNIITNTQLPMVEARLSRRMIELGRLNAAQYLGYIEKNFKEEEVKLIGLLTTHHTHFFREFIQFEALEKELPTLVAFARKRGSKELKIWSAACSRGQEVYSLAMFLKKRLPLIAPDFTFKILGSDVDPESVQVAKNGVYHKREIREVPMAFLKDAWARGSGSIADYVKSSKTIREHCEFRVANLLDFKGVMQGQRFDVIFCRNVFIYFEQQAIVKILNNMLPLLQPQGLFFSGLSESLSQMGLDIEPVGPNIYKKKSAIRELAEPTPNRTAEERVVAVAPIEVVKPVEKVWKMPNPIKLLVVDDSKTVHTIMKKIFHEDPSFEIVGHAMNGLEAEDFLKSNKNVDVVTLDIHMPELDGISYLEKNFSSKHPPVVMVSSANRDDASTALRSLKLGASDFVEKPSLQNMTSLAAELKAKIKTSLIYSASGPSQLDRDFAKGAQIEEPASCLRVVFADLPQIQKIKDVWRSFDGEQPGVVVVPLTHGVFSEAFLAELKSMSGITSAELWNAGAKINPSGLYLAELSVFEGEYKALCEGKQVSVLCFGSPSGAAKELLKGMSGAQILLEELPNALERDISFATDVFPITSFAFVSSQFLSTKRAA